MCSMCWDFDAAVKQQEGLDYEADAAWHDHHDQVAFDAPMGAAGCEPDFIKSATFQHLRPGYVFKLGDAGLGYYRDELVKTLPVTSSPETAMLEYLTFEENSALRNSNRRVHISLEALIVWDSYSDPWHRRAS